MQNARQIKDSLFWASEDFLFSLLLQKCYSVSYSQKFELEWKRCCQKRIQKGYNLLFKNRGSSENNLSPITQLETTLPSFWFSNLKIPSIPPTANVDVSLCMCCKEYITLGLTRLLHSSFLVLHEVNKQVWETHKSKGFNIL